MYSHVEANPKNLRKSGESQKSKKIYILIMTEIWNPQFFFPMVSGWRSGFKLPCECAAVKKARIVPGPPFLDPATWLTVCGTRPEMLWPFVSCVLTPARVLAHIVVRGRSY